MDYKKSFHNIFYIFLFLWSGFLFSQKNEKQNHIDRLINTTNQLYLDGKTENFLATSKEIISLSESMKYEKGIAYGYYYLSAYYYDIAEFRESIHQVKKAQEFKDYLAKDKTLAARISAMLGGNYLLLELYTLSSKNYRNALRVLAGKSGKNTIDSLTESSAYSNMSYLFHNINLQDSMYFYLNRENSILKKIKFKDAYVEKGCSCLGFGNYHSTQNKTDSAVYYYTKSLAFFAGKKHPCKIESLIGLGNLLTQQHDYEKAHEYYNSALQNFENNSFPDIQSELYKKISELYIAQGNATEGKKYQDLYLTSHKKLDSQKKKERDFALNEAMNEEKALHDAEDKKNRKITFIIVFVLILITLFIIYLLKKSKSKNEKVLEITKKLQTEKVITEREKDSLKMQLSDAYEEVRKLARENSPEFFIRFQEVYPHFRIKMLEINPKFKVSELTFGAYIYLGYNTKEIADYTFKAVKTIENNRYNFRKKLGISPDKDLSVWLRNFIDSE
ncbi:tetratricopeptide repeat protein [Chryseobacterium caseinilyticum]|uniref:Tetratricopeptide repeat protein n=1 Tax=Chryseobacterium caseinilyticum TaxID=2771428 RepID=A0ABR8ZCQ9_9FLAO|nr:tetratricopeptide repeat protein [Chryseobacterium caseinilyticum]MBD8083090.1 tetratricopeptide repeat protein [Chryseobacterium caseinilyticum]